MDDENNPDITQEQIDALKAKYPGIEELKKIQDTPPQQTTPGLGMAGFIPSVAETEQRPPETPPQFATQDIINSPGSGYAGFLPTKPSSPTHKQTPENVNLGMQNPDAAQASNAAYNPMQDVQNSQLAGYRANEAAYRDIGALAARQQAEEAAAAAGQAQQSADMVNNFQKIHDQNQQELHNTLADLNNGHINPNRFHENMSVPQKISTAIGMIVAGLGAGLLHQENSVMKWLSEQTNRDVEAQKHDIDSAYHHFYEQTGDARQAENMTRAVLQQNYANQIRGTASKYGGQIAQQNANIMANNIETQQVNPLIAQNSMMQTLHGNQQGVAALPPEQQAVMLSKMGVIPKERMNDIMGEIAKAQNVAKAEKDIMLQFENAAKENTILRTGAGMVREPASASLLPVAMYPALRDITGKISDTEIAGAEKYVPKPGDSEAKINDKRVALRNFLKSNMAATNASGYGIKMPSDNPTFKPYGK